MISFIAWRRALAFFLLRKLFAVLLSSWRFIITPWKASCKMLLYLGRATIRELTILAFSKSSLAIVEMNACSSFKIKAERHD
jgi:hypothetical protein